MGILEKLGLVKSLEAETSLSTSEIIERVKAFKKNQKWSLNFLHSRSIVGMDISIEDSTIQINKMPRFLFPFWAFGSIKLVPQPNRIQIKVEAWFAFQVIVLIASIILTIPILISRNYNLQFGIVWFVIVSSLNVLPFYWYRSHVKALQSDLKHFFEETGIAIWKREN